MKEEFVQFLWSEGLLVPKDFTLADSRKGKVLARGSWNHNSGPDFKDAIIQIDKTTWVGHVEMHIKASEWYAHGHHLDGAYANVVLHVVVEHDTEVLDSNGRQLPVLVIPAELILPYERAYEKWIAQKGVLPCAQLFPSTPKSVVQVWISTMAEERYKHRVEFGWKILEATRGNVELTHWILLARIIAAPFNSDSMEMLMRRIPIILIRRKSWDWRSFEQWMMAISGLTEEKQSDYHEKVFGVEPMTRSQWTYGRLRPPSFPEERVRQLAWVFYSRMMEGSTKHFWNSNFWKGYTGKVKPGVSTLERWHLNMVPYLGLGSWQEGWTSVAEWKAMKPEKNRVTKMFESIGLTVSSALESQALLEIHQKYCGMKKCLNCAVGKYHLKAKEYD
ncbi:MAG: DUF2851 family protein [Flavobacteriia bacterium]|nr:DUF2851 family protein [Flavobacteriia bacterium]